MTTMISKRQRVARWLAYGVLAKLTIFGGAWLLAATAQQAGHPPL